MYRCRITQGPEIEYSSIERMMIVYIVTDNITSAIARHAAIVSGNEYYERYVGMGSCWGSRFLEHAEFREIAESKDDIKDGVDYTIGNLTINIKSIVDCEIDASVYGHCE